VVEANSPIFWETESIRQVNRIKPIQIANCYALLVTSKTQIEYLLLTIVRTQKVRS